MLSRLNCITGFFIALLLCFGGFAHAQSSAVSQTAPAALCTLRGHVTDPTGALIPGAQITVTTAQGTQAVRATADSAGAYVVRGLAPGSYIVQAEFSGFSTFVSTPIPIEAGQTKNIDIKLALEQATQQVEVSAEGGPTVSTEAGSNASAIVLKGKDLDALSDDPDELSNELSALAGPSAGPNGGQIYIDGFTGGQLPPKSAIREIRINQNPFSAEFDRLGYGRIEILTKPGTDQLHGRGFLMGNDDAFNTGNPFTKNIPAYHSIMGNATVSGPLSKNASFFVSVEQRNTQDASIYSAAVPLQNASGQWYLPTDANGNPIPVTGGLFSPETHTSISPRFDVQLGQKNTLTMRWQFWRSHESGQIGNTALPSTNSTSQNVENTLQFDDTQIINDRVVNETRFEYRRASNWETPDSTAPAVSVPAYFTQGGNAAQSTSGHSDHFELQDFVTMTAGAHAIKFGAWLRDNRQATSASSGFNGTFNFPSLNAYLDTLNGMAAGETVADIAKSCPAGQQCTPNKLTYTTGPYAFYGNLFDAAAYVQDDWKYNRFLTLSGGLRWESQNHVTDHSDFAPRVAFAYALDGHKNQKQAKTVLRGGFGFFYDRFQIQNLMNLEQYNGTAKSQTTTVITNPTCFDANSLQNALKQGCSAAGASPQTPQIDTITSNYHSPYAETLGASIERQLTHTSTLTLTYVHYFGLHQMVVRNANAFLPGTYQYGSSTLTGVRPTSYQGIVDQYYPEAVFKQNQLIVNINAQFSRNFSVGGYYNWSNANSNGGGGSNPTNSYDLNQDYGRASFVRPQFLFLMGNYNAPWGVSFSPFLVAESGRPYSITTANDLTGDNFFNDRPSYASAASDPNDVAHTSYGAFDTQPQPGEALLPPGMLYSPSALAFNLRASRAFGFGPSTETSAGPMHDHGGGPGGGHSHGGFGGGNIFGGGGGGFHGGPAGTGRKYSLTFSVQALNLFNDVNYGTPSGTVIPTLNPGTGVIGPGKRFGESTKLAGGMFNSPTGSATRRVFIQAFVSF